MASKKKSSNMAWGITLLLFGFLFLLRQLQIVPPEVGAILFDIKNFPLIAGVIFLFFHPSSSIGIVLLAVGVLFRLSEIIAWTKNFSEFILPVLLIVAGGILIFGKRK